MSSTYLSCGVDSQNANYATRWITPDGEIITQNETTDARLTVIEGNGIQVPDGRIIDGTALILMNLSYQDEGVYTCEARDLLESDSPWRQATSELSLLGRFV